MGIEETAVRPKNGSADDDGGEKGPVASFVDSVPVEEPGTDTGFDVVADCNCLRKESNGVLEVGAE